MRNRILRILIEICILLFTVYISGYINTHFILAYVFIALSIEIFLSMKIESNITSEVKICPCCKFNIKRSNLWKYAYRKILQNSNYYYCENCSQIIANLEYYEKKMLVVTIFAFGIIEIFLITFKYYILALAMIFIWGLVYIYTLTNVKIYCYKDKDKIKKNDPIYNEWKKEKHLKLLLGILWFLFLIFALVLKFFIL